MSAHARAHHRHHRPGRLLPRRPAAREGLRGPRHGPPLLDGEVRAHRAHPRPHHAAPGRPARPALAGRRAARRAPGRDLQPRRDVVRRGVLDPADADGRVHRRRASRACSRRCARSCPEARFYQASLERDVRQGARDAADRVDAVLPALALRRGEGLRPLHHGQLPRVVRPACVSGILFNHECVAEQHAADRPRATAIVAVETPADLMPLRRKGPSVQSCHARRRSSRSGTARTGRAVRAITATRRRTHRSRPPAALDRGARRRRRGDRAPHDARRRPRATLRADDVEDGDRAGARATDAGSRRAGPSVTDETGRVPRAPGRRRLRRARRQHVRFTNNDAGCGSASRSSGRSCFLGHVHASGSAAPASTPTRRRRAASTSPARRASAPGCASSSTRRPATSRSRRSSSTPTPTSSDAFLAATTPATASRGATA